MRRSALRDLLDEAAAGVAARPGRLALTVLGTVLGVATLVATLGIAQTASGQISDQFDLVTATEVIVRPRRLDDAVAADTARLPWDAAARVSRLVGTVSAGTIAEVNTGGKQVRAVPIVDPAGTVEHDVPVFATSADAIHALRGTVATGRYFDAGHDARTDPVAVLGSRAAERLNITRTASQPVIFVGDHVFTVIGILDALPRYIEMDDAIIIPQSTAGDAFGLTAPESLWIRTELGAARLIGRQAPISLDPNAPERFEAAVPPSAEALRGRVQADVNALLLVLGGIALLVGTLGIANVTLLSVLERVGEIGLRSALGATRGHITRLFLAESVTIGLLGGLIGASVGVTATVSVSLVREWTPILDLRLALAAPLLGGVVGLLSGAYPARKAATLDPVEALRA